MLTVLHLAGSLLAATCPPSPPAIQLVADQAAPPPAVDRPDQAPEAPRRDERRRAEFRPAAAPNPGSIVGGM